MAEFDGVLKIDTPAGETVPIGTVVGGIDTDATASMTTTAKSEEPTPDPTPAPSTASTPATEEPKAAPSAGNGTTTEIKVPSVGESITEAAISEWAKENGAAVARDDVLLSLDTDKASVEVVAEHSGNVGSPGSRWFRCTNRASDWKNSCGHCFSGNISRGRVKTSSSIHTSADTSSSGSGWRISCSVKPCGSTNCQ